MRHDFGKEARAATISGWFKLYSDDTPSPNRYVPEPEFGPHGTAPQYTFGGKTEFKEEPTPGPLDYDVPQAFRKLKMGASYTMGSKTKGSSFIQEDKEKTPGPDAYMPKVAFTEKSATLKGHHKDLPVLNTPGPTNYIMPSTLFSGPQYSLTGRNIPYQSMTFL